MTLNIILAALSKEEKKSNIGPEKITANLELGKYMK